MEYYRTFSTYLKKKFNTKIWRIPLSTGLPCPNRTEGRSGCTFCNGDTYLPAYLMNKNTGDLTTASLEEQLERGREFFSKRYKTDTFFGYFQSNTNTYGDEDELLEKFRFVISREYIKGLAISTRPDYITRSMLEKIAALAAGYPGKDFWIELGLQSVHEKTLERIERNHTYGQFKEAVSLIKKLTGCKICVHLILGLPGETEQMMRDGVKQLFTENSLDAVKFRMLDILEGTEIAGEYGQHPGDFVRFSDKSFVNLMCDLLEHIPQEVIIMRFANYKSLFKLELERRTDKNMSKGIILQAVQNEFERRGTRQGIYCS